MIVLKHPGGYAGREQALLGRLLFFVNMAGHRVLFNKPDHYSTVRTLVILLKWANADLRTTSGAYFGAIFGVR
jgi:hypothetical protein